jgi:2'-5' RNA ligase
MRVFVALVPPLAARLQLGELISTLRPLTGRARWVAPENLHITLQFLGDLEKCQLAQVEQICAKVAAAQKALLLTTTGLGCFPPRGQPRVLYLSTDQQQPLRALAGALAAHLQPCGFDLPDRFHSHLTLARLKKAEDRHRRRRLLAFNAPEISFRLTELVLLGSTLTASGPRYEVLQRTPLQPSGS